MKTVAVLLLATLASMSHQDNSDPNGYDDSKSPSKIDIIETKTLEISCQTRHTCEVESGHIKCYDEDMKEANFVSDDCTLKSYCAENTLLTKKVKLEDLGDLDVEALVAEAIEPSK